MYDSKAGIGVGLQTVFAYRGDLFEVSETLTQDCGLHLDGHEGEVWERCHVLLSKKHLPHGICLLANLHQLRAQSIVLRDMLEEVNDG